MGKGNRSRIERAMNESVNTEKNVQAKKRKVSGAGIFVAIAAILVVVALLVGAIGVVNDSGWFARSQTVIKTDHFEVDGSMMNYFFTTQFNFYYQQYSQMFQSYANSGIDVDALINQYMGITDANKSLKDQNMPAAEGAETVTVFDYYMSLTEDYVARMLTYCEFAVANNIKLDDNDYADIDKSIEDMETTYKTYKSLYESIGYAYPSTFSAYLAQNYGTGVKVKDIRNCLELITLAAKYETQLKADKKELITTDTTNKAVEEFVKENPSLFLMADYYSYTFTVNNKNKTDAEFEAEKAEILEKAKKLAAATDKESFKAAYIEAEKELFREKNWDKYLKENGNDEAKANEKLEEYFEKTYTDSYIDSKFSGILKEGYKYPDVSLPQYDPENETSYDKALDELRKWVFGFIAEDCEEGKCDHKDGEAHDEIVAAKPGDITFIESTKTSKEKLPKETTGATTEAPTTEESTTDAAAPASEEATTKEETTTQAPTSTPTEIDVTTYTVTVYLLEKATYRDEEISKHFGYVMYSSKADAEKFFAEYSKLGDNMNKDTLVETVEKMYEEIKPYAYDDAEDYLVGTLEDEKVIGVDKWLREVKDPGHSDVIEVTYTTSTTVDGKPKENKKTYYAVLVYDQDGYAAWYNTALEGAIDNAIADWYDENGLELTFNEKAYRFIDA